MRLKWATLFVVGATLLSGCSGGAKKSASNSGGGTTAPLPSRPDVGPGNPLNGDSADPRGPKPPIPEMPKPDPERFVIPKTGANGWKTAAVDGKELASKIGAALASLQGTEGETVATIKTPTGNGQVIGKVKVQDSKSFSIQYLIVDEMPALKEIRSNGKLKATSTDQGAFPKKGPVTAQTPESRLTSSQLASDWPRKFPQLVFLGLTDKKDPWKPLIDELLSGRSGFKTEIAERTMEYKGRKVSNYRLTAKRTEAAAKQYGPCEMEMVFDGKRFLPVTIRVNFEDPAEGKYQVLWQTGWNFLKKFKPEEFAL